MAAETAGRRPVERGAVHVCGGAVQRGSIGVADLDQPVCDRVHDELIVAVGLLGAVPVGAVPCLLGLVGFLEQLSLVGGEQVEAAWNRADRDNAEEAYGDYQLVVDAIADRLIEIRDTYAGTLEGSAADEYRASFNRSASRRFRRHGTIATDLRDG